MRILRACLALALAVASAPLTAQQPPLDSAFFAGMKARSIGPAGMSGRIGAIEGVASDPNIIYVGAATGGLWKSTNGGVSWTPLTDDIPAASIGAIAVFQAAPDIVWIGTGEKARRNTAGVGTGVYKSMDAGKTWMRVGLDQTVAVSEIILHPTDPNVAYVAALGNTWAESEHRGVYKTTDGGKTWTKVLYVNATTGAADLVMDPQNPNKLIAAMWEHHRWPWFFTSGGEGSGLYVTWDGGATWEKRTEKDGLPAGTVGRIGLDIARSNPQVVYALVEAKKSVLLRSADGGRTFETVNRDDEIGDRPFYYQQLRVDPANENRVYTVAGVVRLSEDGGRTFRTLLPFARVHVDHHAYWVNPLDGRMIVDGNDGGVYISRDRGATWRFVENLPLAQFYHIALDDATPYHVMGGLQDNGSWRGPSSVWQAGGIRNYQWEEVDFGDGFATMPVPGDQRYGYAMSQGGELVRWDAVTGERKDVKPAHPQGVPLRFNWNAGIAVGPDGAIYFGSQFVHKSTDRGETWTIISPDLTTNDPAKQRQDSSGGLTYDVTTAENHTTIMTIAPSPVDRGVMWVGTDDGNVQVTRDGGATWTNVADRIKGVPAATWVPDIEASRFDAATAFVVFDDHRRGNFAPYVFKTTDYGRTWTSLVTPAVGYFLHAIEQDPVETSLLYLGGEFGMYVSLDGGTSWQLWRAGIPRVPVLAFAVHPRDHDLVIATHGRAAYVLDDVEPLRALARDRRLAAEALHLFPVAAGIQHVVKQADGSRFMADAMFAGENRPYGALLTYAVRSGSDSAKATVQALDGGGAVIRTFPGPANTGVNRAVWDLRRDGFRRPKGSRTGNEDFGPSGADVLPGRYTVRVIVGGDTATAPVEVRPDPRYTIPDADRKAKDDAVMAVGKNLETAAEAADRLKDAMDGLQAVADRLASRSDDASKALKAGADSTRQALRKVREMLTGPEGLQGIIRDSDAAIPLLNEALGRLQASWDRPTAAQQLAAAAGAEKVRAAVEATNRVFADDVTAFRTRLTAAGFELLPAKEPLRM